MSDSIYFQCANIEVCLQEFFQDMGAGHGVWLGPEDVAFETVWVTPAGVRYQSVGLVHSVF